MYDAFTHYDQYPEPPRPTQMPHPMGAAPGQPPAPISAAQPPETPSGGILSAVPDVFVTPKVPTGSPLRLCASLFYPNGFPVLMLDERTPARRLLLDGSWVWVLDHSQMTAQQHYTLILVHGMTSFDIDFEDWTLNSRFLPEQEPDIRPYIREVRGPLLRNGDYIEVREEWILSAPDPRIQQILERVRQEQQAQMPPPGRPGRIRRDQGE